MNFAYDITLTYDMTFAYALGPFWFRQLRGLSFSDCRLQNFVMGNAIKVQSVKNVKKKICS